MHGHNYVVFVTARGVDRDTDEIGRVVDFSVLKEKIGGWIDTHWDHGFLVWSEDTNALAALAISEPVKIYVMDRNPTAENMARHLLHEVVPSLLQDCGVVVTSVVVWETENCFAEAKL
jgi:6-pyruvoyltetrahydropterin/6-carboxytetrahydropterin synthase